MSPFINFKNLKLKKTNNQYLVIPRQSEIELTPNIFSPIFECKVGNLQSYWFEVVNKQDGIGEVRNDERNYKFKCIQYSKVFKFPDIVDVEFYKIDEDLSTLAIYSRSKYGYYDFKVNKNRINLWLNILNNYTTIHQ